MDETVKWYSRIGYASSSPHWLLGKFGQYARRKLTAVVGGNHRRKKETMFRKKLNYILMMNYDMA